MAFVAAVDMVGRTSAAAPAERDIDRDVGAVRSASLDPLGLLERREEAVDGHLC